MDTKEREFLEAYWKLCKEHGYIFTSCGCCGGHTPEKLEPKKEIWWTDYETSIDEYIERERLGFTVGGDKYSDYMRQLGERQQLAMNAEGRKQFKK